MDVESKPNRHAPRKPFLAGIVHLARVAIIAGLLLAIPSPRARTDDSSKPPALTLVQSLVDSVASIDASADVGGLWAVRDTKGNVVGKVARTLPIAQDVVGYRGPSETLILFDDKLKISSVLLLGSSDTVDHVEAINRSADFFDQFRGWTWTNPSDSPVDAVSGATLTSFAIAEGIIKRMGGDQPSLVFPDPITDAERKAWLDPNDEPDSLIRTGPISDDIAGYQGPTELLIKRDGETVKKIRLRFSFDNEEYVGYVAEDEWGFWPLFEGKTFAELAQLDLEAEGIDGVSGATMTSQSVARTIVHVAKEIESDKQASVEAEPRSLLDGLRWQTVDTFCIFFLCALLALSRWKLFRRKWLRRVWLLAVVILIGLWSGNLVSMALVAGWSAEGIAWKLAPGLAAIAGVAMLFPPLTKSNPYCNHLCPHGAIQQLVRPGAKSKRNWRLPGKLSAVLRWVPGVTLVIAYLMIILRPATDLSSWEPFHAYLFRIAGWGSLTLAIGTLVFSALVPMGYCRLGCPTGRLLDHLRRNSNSQRIQLADIVSLLLLIVAIGIRSSSIGL